MKQYILYDYLQVAGGAERLALDLAAGMPDYKLVVSRIFPESLPLAPFSTLEPGNLISLGTPLTKGLQRIPEALLNFTCRSGFLRDAKVAVYSGIYAPLAVRYQQSGSRIYYCHTPPRFVYDWKDRYVGRLNSCAQPLANGLISVFQKRYESSLGQMDRIVANSENVRGRLRQYLGIDAEVVHPPVDTEKFKWVGQGDYFISVARLEKYKRVEMIIEAFLQRPDQKLVIASGGSQEMQLKELAKDADNITFTGWQTEQQLRELVGRARAAIYMPRDEDFGMSPIEAMSAGKPVIGVAEGGLLETVIDGQTGILVSPDAELPGLIDAIDRMTGRQALDMREACEARAQTFSKAVFLDRMRALLPG